MVVVYPNLKSRNNKSNKKIREKRSKPLRNLYIKKY